MRRPRSLSRLLWWLGEHLPPIRRRRDERFRRALIAAKKISADEPVEIVRLYPPDYRIDPTK